MFIAVEAHSCDYTINQDVQYIQVQLAHYKANFYNLYEQE